MAKALDLRGKGGGGGVFIHVRVHWFSWSTEEKEDLSAVYTIQYKYFISQTRGPFEHYINKHTYIKYQMNYILCM